MRCIFDTAGNHKGCPLRRRGDTNLVGAGLVPARFACCNHIAKTLIRTRQDLLDEPLHLLGLAHLGEALRVQRLPTNRVARSPPNHTKTATMSSPSSQLQRRISEPPLLHVGSPRVGVLLLPPVGASVRMHAQAKPIRYPNLTCTTNSAPEIRNFEQDDHPNPCKFT